MLTIVVFLCLAEKGRYGLPMPKSRCPSSSGFHWVSGYIYQDLENDNSRTTVSSGAHFRGWVSNDVVQYFCVKNHSSPAIDANRGPWPAGEYCIYQKGSSCPAGMQRGSVLWDDENINGTNKNNNSGSLPAGVYNEDTKIFFCCQTSGYYFNPIELPIDKPFYLIAWTSYCQYVLNTVHRMEYIVYDTEDDNNHDKQTYPLPYGANFTPEPHIYYCYYEACSWTLTALKGTFSSPYYPKNYNDKAYCKWNISVPWNYTIALTFTDFTLEWSCCRCDYVEVWETLTNGSEVLIERFCDGNSNRPDPFKPVRSNGNNMAVIFHSDRSINAKGFQASYQAFSAPDTEVTPTAGVSSTSKKNETTTATLLATTTISSNTTFPKPTGAKTSASNNSDAATVTTTEVRTSTTSTDGESVHEASHESASTGMITYVIVGVVASLIVIGGTVVGVVLCFCRKRLTNTGHSDRDRLGVQFTSSKKTVAGVTNIAIPDIYQRSDHEDERYSDVNKLENINVLYDCGDGLNKPDKDKDTETENPLYASSTDTVSESDNPLYERKSATRPDKDKVQQIENPLYASSDDIVQENDNPMYESVDETLRGTTDHGIDNQVYEMY